MEYIKKEELKDGDVFVSEMTNYHFLNKEGTEFSLDLNTDNTIKKEILIKGCGFSYRNIRLATPEEKHWLNTCIELDKFITFEESMKTFIPEYVECIREEMHNFFGKLGTIYKVIDWNHSVTDCMLEGTTSGPTCKNRFKLSTKEAYDAQFVVKEPEFVLPEKWCVLRNENNYTIINKWCNENHLIGENYYYTDNNKYLIYSKQPSNSWNAYKRLCNSSDISFIEITFEQFKKYVLKEETVVEEVKTIEPLPQFKVIESVETITKVENNEGNQFFIGDVVKSNYSEVVHNIKNFKYNVDKTNILAITEKLPGGIGIDKIEHYIEPKIETQFKIGDIIKISTNPADGSQPEYLNNTYKIIKIRGNQLLFETNSIPPINSVLTKNAIKVN